MIVYSCLRPLAFIMFQYILCDYLLFMRRLNLNDSFKTILSSHRQSESWCVTLIATILAAVSSHPTKYLKCMDYLISVTMKTNEKPTYLQSIQGVHFTKFESV